MTTSAQPVMLCTCGKVLETPRDYAAHCKEFPSHFVQTAPSAPIIPESELREIIHAYYKAQGLPLGMKIKADGGIVLAVSRTIALRVHNAAIEAAAQIADLKRNWAVGVDENGNEIAAAIRALRQEE